MSVALRRGDTGETVRDLQLRLTGAGFTCADPPGRFGDRTEAAVREFQRARGLRADGICGQQTWTALVESGYSLGDRLLYRRRPMLRGDDVAELQRLLNALGFDAGREDGILGDETADAVAAFQRDVGLGADVICGPTTVAALRRVAGLAEGSIASLREREALRAGGRLAGRRVYVHAHAGLGPLARRVGAELGHGGADVVLEAAGADQSQAAREANRFDADLCLTLRPGDEPAVRCAFFQSGRFRSEGGYRVARRLQEEISNTLSVAGEAVGRTYPILRETRMPSVVCELLEGGDVVATRTLATRSDALATAVVNGVRRGVEEPLDEDR